MNIDKLVTKILEEDDTPITREIPMRQFPSKPEPVQLLGYVHRKPYGQTVLTLYRGKKSVDIVIGRYYSGAEYFGEIDDATPDKSINAVYEDGFYNHLKEFMT